jgi:two-component system cell cycle response regulator CtrA
VARVPTVVGPSDESVVRTGDLAVNLNAKIVAVNGARVHLTGREYQVLELLSLRKGFVLTKKMFLNHLYPGAGQPELKIIDVLICTLRKKLAGHGQQHIETIRRRGYALRDPPESEIAD